MAWLYLIGAGLLEIVWAYSLKLSHDSTRRLPAIVTLLAMLASFGLLAASMKTLPLGIAYVVWTGIGVVGTFTVGVLLLGEPLNAPRVAAAALVVAGVIALKLAG